MLDNPDFSMGKYFKTASSRSKLFSLIEMEEAE